MSIKLRERLDEFQVFMNADACMIISDATRNIEQMQDALQHFLNSIKYSSYIVSVLDFYVDEDEWNPYGQRVELRELQSSILALLLLIKGMEDGRIKRVREAMLNLSASINTALAEDE